MLAEVVDVSKRFSASGRHVAALRDVSLQLDRGDFVAVRGPSGCGKSTLLLTLGGLLRPDQGKVMVAGCNLYELSANRRAIFRAETIGFVFQQFYLVPYLNVHDNILAARLGLSGGVDGALKARVEQLMERFGLQDRWHHKPGQLSTGERQRVALARAMLNQPQILLADEPTGNLDPANAEEVLRQLDEFKQHGGAVLLVTHDENAAARADRVMYLEQGCVATA